MSSPVWSFNDLVLSQKPKLSKASLPIDGKSLTISDVIAVSRDLSHVELTSQSIDAINRCSTIIPEKIARGDVIYGVNTGFGGSADTRSNDVERVQQSLISHLTCGIIADDIRPFVPKTNGLADQSNGHADQANGHSEHTNGHSEHTNGHFEHTNGHSEHTNGHSEHTNGHTEHTNGHATNGHATNGHATNGHATNGHATNGHATNGNATNGYANQSNGSHSSNGYSSKKHDQRAIVRSSLPLNDPLASTCMAESWSRASMLIRLNSLAGGASGIRLDIASSLVDLLNKDVVPRIPVRGSISASGDLSALAWIGAVMQGKPSATAYTGPRLSTTRTATRADLALASAGIAPVSLHAKEGLAIVNGTAVSAAVASLAAYESVNLAALSQVLTAMSVEALRGSDESFEPFIGRVRPHSGQVDSARNIKAFLGGSRLLNRHDSADVSTLRQDRYSLRTSSQWIGPVLEDFCLAYHQLTVELNSVTDNPLIDPDTDRVFHGGNFQARAVTSAVEKLRQGLQSIGRMLFTQCTEMINPSTSWGLPPNLSSDSAHDSFLFKGLDVVIAGLTSELGFLANPVGSHVQTAEMGNQSLNSLALVSARYTLEAVDVLSQIAAAHLLAVCQALDLRAIEIEGRKEGPPDAGPYLGRAARRVYGFVRGELGVPFLGEAHLAEREEVGPLGTAPSVGLYNTRVYQAVRSGRLFDVVFECLEEVVERGDGPRGE